jgi:hypothetical protein
MCAWVILCQMRHRCRIRGQSRVPVPVCLSVCHEMKMKSVNEMKIHGCRGKPAQGSVCDSLNYQTLFSLLVTPHNPH